MNKTLKTNGRWIFELKIQKDFQGYPKDPNEPQDLFTVNSHFVKSIKFPKFKNNLGEKPSLVCEYYDALGENKELYDWIRSLPKQSCVAAIILYCDELGNAIESFKYELEVKSVKLNKLSYEKNKKITNSTTKIKFNVVSTESERLEESKETIGSLTELLANGLEKIKIAMNFDPDLAWVWHCNFATAFMDEGAKPRQANKAAARIMQSFFKIDVTTFEQWNGLEEIWKKPDLPYESLKPTFQRPPQTKKKP